MKKILLVLITSSLLLQAGDVVLTKEHETNWQIKTQNAKQSATLPIGSYMAEVVVPSTLEVAVTIPFALQLEQLYKNPYTPITKGEPIAKLGGAAWITLQQEAIGNAVAAKEAQMTANRQNRLCKEGIIAQKECITSNALLKTQNAKLAASKSLLESFGADEKTISTITKSLQMVPSLIISSPVSGQITSLNTAVGKQIDPSTALAVILKEGSLWLQADLPTDSINVLSLDKEVTITIADKSYTCTVFQISPTIHPKNQTREVIFALPKEAKLLKGYRANATIATSQASLVIPKTAVIKQGDDQVVFLKTQTSYKSESIEILGEDKHYYYVKPKPALKEPLATTSLAVLKSMMEE